MLLKSNVLFDLTFIQESQHKDKAAALCRLESGHNGGKVLRPRNVAGTVLSERTVCFLQIFTKQNSPIRTHILYQSPIAAVTNHTNMGA